MDLSIIIVSWETREKLRHNLKALFLSEGDFKFEVFVVDNNSSDKSAEMVASEFPEVKLIRNKKNEGFAKANNCAIQKAQGRFILLLNPDMKLYSNSLEKALLWAEKNTQAVVSGFRLLSENGKLVAQVRKFPKLFDQLMIILKIPHFFPFVLNSYLQKDFNYNKAQVVDSIRGSFFLINVKSWQDLSGKEKPYLDERYFVWFEEVDFCRQVKSLGGEVWYSPASEALDYVGQSFSLLKRRQAQGYFRDSMLKYFKKWGKPNQVFVLRFAWNLLRVFIR
ncbi:glycosyltransferase family 2 protein [Candidatus Falkowbacteria bacterium]|nr:glycosyltransferase family 2 protein [Candidatus Falkowbacteria bacterium]